MSKSQSKYDPSFCSKILELGKQGYSRAEVASEFKVNRKTVYDWSNDTSKPEFMAAYEQYETELEAYIQKSLRLQSEGKTKGNCPITIYRARTLLGQKCPEYLIDLKKEIKHETQSTPTQVRDELKKILSNNFNLLQFITTEDENVGSTDKPRSTS